MTDLKYVRSNEDSLTNFSPTKKDLELLATALADEIIAADGCESFGHVKWEDYRWYRLNRILEYLPEIESRIEEKLPRTWKNQVARLRAKLRALEANEPLPL